MQLVLKAIKYQFLSQWSDKYHFFTGIIGMLVNNTMVLVGIWAMIFAGKTGLNEARDGFLIMNFVLMLSWGYLHCFLGGISTLEKQINDGTLDLALVGPRNPFLVLSINKSYLPAWGDIALGLIGILIYSFKLGIIFFFQALLMSVFSFVALYAFFLSIGSLAFWFRRLDVANNVLINMCLAFNTYPIFNGDYLHRWLIVLVPILLVGLIPSDFLLQPSLKLLLVELIGSILFFFVARFVFYYGLKKYQSNSLLGSYRG